MPLFRNKDLAKENNSRPQSLLHSVPRGGSGHYGHRLNKHMLINLCYGSHKVTTMSWLFWYCIISHCIFTLILYKLTENLNNPAVKLERNAKRDCQKKKVNSDAQNTSSLESSLWCHGQDKSERICKFRNLYYSPSLREYIFFHGNSSIVQGVPTKRCSPALLDLTSVEDHNLQYFNFQDAPVSALKYFSETVNIDHPSLLFHRFNPENIMHVIHDDLLPLFYTLRQYFQDFEQQNKLFNTDIQIIFMEGRAHGPYIELYELFSNQKPLLSADILSKTNNSLQSLVCFQEVTVGISKSTTWYNYGFHVSQGPIPNHTADGNIIKQFTEYVTNKLETTSKPKDSNYVILFSRESNRLILNELELTFSIATSFNLQVTRLSLETNKLDEIIKQIQGSVGIIGMHGSMLVLSMFLRPGSFVIELFPYAINPENYTPYKTLAEIMDIPYFSWQNKIKNNTVAYPNRTKSEGGIMHLDKKMQANILNTDEVPTQLCCEDPYWLFRIYQDTIVNIPTFIQVMKNALNETKRVEKKDVKKYPGKIRNVFCKCLESENGVAIFAAWEPSWNMQFYDPPEVSSEVWIQDISDQNYMAYSFQGVTEHTFDENIKNDTLYNIWVRGVINANTGPFSDVCTCSTY